MGIYKETAMPGESLNIEIQVKDTQDLTDEFLVGVDTMLASIKGVDHWTIKNDDATWFYSEDGGYWEY